jgi:hypothetical protein
MMSSPTNENVADIFEEIAALLEAQKASPFRVNAWWNGARTVRALPRWVGDVFREQGRQGLDDIPSIGRGLAAVIIEILQTGRARALERLRGEVSPVEMFADLPGIGDELAHRIHGELGIDTLEELERAAHDGRLAALEGFGAKRVRAIREVLAARMSRRPASRAFRLPAPERSTVPVPSIALLLDEDRRYRELAAAGQLPRIAPRRFNPSGEAWLPIFHEDRDGWTMTVLYSNTQLAHELGKTGDWVVVYYDRDGEEGRATVVTEIRGPLRGRRVVRGRERDCADHYRTAARPENDREGGIACPQPLAHDR